MQADEDDQNQTRSHITALIHVSSELGDVGVAIVPECDKLHNVALRVLPLVAQSPRTIIIYVGIFTIYAIPKLFRTSVENVHFGEVRITHADNDDRQRQVTRVHNLRRSGGVS